MDFLEKTKKPIYLFLIFVIYLSYFLAFFGVYYVNPNMLEFFSFSVNVFVCLFLLIRFHPFQKHELRPFDDKLIFASGIILLSNIGINAYFQDLYDKTKHFYEIILK
jgi:hypothetical protein